MKDWHNQQNLAVIWYMASRPCLKKNLELLYKNFNNKYKYPVLVTTFGKQYSKRFIRNIHKNIDPSIKFIEIEKPKVPSHVKEEELFYNRKEIPYVRNSFPKSRIGFLHTNQFVAGEIMEHSEMKKYDYVLKMDDDTFIIQGIDFDLFKFMKDNNYKFASSALKKRDSERRRSRQIGLRELVKNYIKKNNIQCGILNKSLDKHGDWDSITPYDPAVWDLNIFRNSNWKNWWNCVNESGGIYKYRWGDLEIHALYMRMHYSDSAWYNFDFYKKGKCKHGGYGPVYHAINSKGMYKYFCFLIGRLKFILANQRKTIKIWKGKQ